MNHIEFVNTFNYRHDFGDPEVSYVLEYNHSNIKFINIPVAWIWPIDDMLWSIKNKFKD